MIIMSNMLYILSHARLSNIRVQSMFTWEKWDLGFFFSFFVDVLTNTLIHLSLQPFLRFQILIGITKNYAIVNKIDAMSVFLTYSDDLVGTFVGTKPRVHRLEFCLHFELKHFDSAFWNWSYWINSLQFNYSQPSSFKISIFQPKNFHFSTRKFPFFNPKTSDFSQKL